MARRRIYGDDYAIAEWHRHALPELYIRNGHRLDMADRDWTEFCHYCRTPLSIWECVMNRGQDLRDKSTTVTQRLAQRAGVPALLVAATVDRPADVQRRITDLGRELVALTAADPVVRFTVRRLTPELGPFVVLEPEEFAAELYTLHRDHHTDCVGAVSQDPILNHAALGRAVGHSRIWTTRQLGMFD